MKRLFAIAILSLALPVFGQNTLGEYAGAGSAQTLLLYHFDTGASVPIDSSGNGNNLSTKSGTCTPSNQGMFGSGVVFNASSYYTTGGNVSWNGKSVPFTQSFWTKLNITPPSRTDFANHGGGGLNNTNGCLIYYNNANQWLTYDITVSVQTDATFPAYSTWSNKWTNIIFVYDGGTITTSSCRFYLNGQMYPITISSANKAWAFTAGLSTAGASAGGGYSMDEYILEKTNWTSGMVRNYYNAAKGRYVGK